jgi:hypothetical protein
MVKPEIVDEMLHLHVEGMDKVWAFKSQLSIPLKHITSIRLDQAVAQEWFHGLKMPGTTIPGIITAGTFYQDGKRVFWDIHNPKEVVIISLSDEHFSELVVEVQNPGSFVKEVQARIHSRSQQGR